MDKTDPFEVLDKARREFPFTYAGGGYFRMKGVPKGAPAPILHGIEVLEAYNAHLLQYMEKRQPVETDAS